MFLVATVMITRLDVQPVYIIVLGLHATTELVKYF